MHENYEEMDCNYNLNLILDVELDVCQPMDVIDDDSFDMVIDKATLDAILCHQKPQERVPQMMEVRLKYNCR